MKWEDKLEIGGLSDVGMRRSNNQDSFRTLPASTPEQWQRRGHLFVVADGMGAHAVGELASKLAVDSIPHMYHKLVHLSCAEAITKSFQDANALIHNRGTANRDFQGMGTTSTALVLLPDGALVAHVGDSRAYRVRNGHIEQLSFDHSLAWELVRRRHLTAEQARTMVPSNVITRSLGPEPEAQVDLEGPHALEPGDIFVLCTDGLSGQVGDSEIGALARYLPPQDACQYLVDMANLRGGPDNITVVVVRVGNPSPVDEDQTARSTLTLADRLRNYSTLYLILGIIGLVGWFGLGLAGWYTFGQFGAGGSRLACGAIGLLLAVAGSLGHFYFGRRAEQTSLAKTNAYRRAACTLDDTLLGSFSDRLRQLQAVAVEQAWNMDWSEFFTYRNAADRLIEANDRVAALREFCQALHMLAIAQRRHIEDTDRLLETNSGFPATTPSEQAKPELEGHDRRVKEGGPHAEGGESDRELSAG